MSQIKLLFCGDFIASGAYESIVMQKKENIFGDVLSLIKSSDFSFVNLETPLTSEKSYVKKPGPTLKSSLDTSKILKLFSLVGLANNHILDYGKKGLEDTLKAFKDQGVATVGASLNLNDDEKTYITDVKGVKIGVLAITENYNQDKEKNFGTVLMDPIENFHQIKNLKLKSDFLIVTFHGGIHNFPYPSPTIRKMCKFYVDLGADAVVCHHPHVPGAYEFYKGNPIIYSLGDLIYHHQNPNKMNNFGYIAQFHIDTDNKKLTSFSTIPYKQSIKFDGIKLLKGQEKDSFLTILDNYCKNMKNENLWLREWNSMVKEREESFILRLLMPITFKGLGILIKYTPLLKILLNKKSLPKKLDIIRSQSYREILIQIFESKIKK